MLYPMNQSLLNLHAECVWQDMQSIFPKLRVFTCPRIMLNGRLRTTAGLCYQADRIIYLNTKMILGYERYMLSTILPHELCHQVDYDLFGAVNKKDWHRLTWQRIMVLYGLEPAPFISV